MSFGVRSAMIRAALFLTLLLSTSASADAIAVPSECPDGSRGAMCHGPETCAPDLCATDADCSSGRCRELSLCTQEHCCGGRGCAMDTGVAPPSFTHVSGECSDACTTGCETLMVCVGESGSGGDGGGCSAGGATGGVLVALAFLLVLRRRCP